MEALRSLTKGVFGEDSLEKEYKNGKFFSSLNGLVEPSASVAKTKMDQCIKLKERVQERLNLISSDDFKAKLKKVEASERCRAFFRVTFIVLAIAALLFAFVALGFILTASAPFSATIISSAFGAAIMVGSAAIGPIIGIMGSVIVVAGAFFAFAFIPCRSRVQGGVNVIKANEKKKQEWLERIKDLDSRINQYEAIIESKGDKKSFSGFKRPFFEGCSQSPFFSSL